MGVPTPVWKTAGYDHPNAVAALMAKRAELVTLRTKLEREVKRITYDIDHIDGAIRVFDPNEVMEFAQRYQLQYRAKGGQITASVMNSFRTGGGPFTSRDLTKAWMTERNIRPDRDTYILIRRRVGSCLTKLCRMGVLRVIETGKLLKLYELVRE